MSSENAARDKAVARLKKFLGNVKVWDRKDPFSHTTREPSGSYYIGDDEMKNFWVVYCNAVRKGGVVTLTEKPSSIGPLRVDFDLKASLDTGLARQYTPKMLKTIVGMYQALIREIVDEDSFEEKMTWCVVLEKKKPRVEQGIIKDGFHLHFPHFDCEGWIQDELLRNKVTERMIEHNTWKGTKYLEPVDKFIDTNMARKQWLMYGSAKSEKARPYLATRFYDHETKSTTAERIFEDEMIGRTSKASYYLPVFLSIRGCCGATTLKPEIERKKSVYTRKVKRAAIVKKRSTEEVLADIKTILDGNIMEMISDDRAEAYETWIDMCWTLFGISQGSDEGLELFKEFSQRSVKYNEQECEEVWANTVLKGKTIGSLLMMARSDSPDEYAKWKSSQVKNTLEASLKEPHPNEWDVAQVIRNMYKDRFVCADAKKDIWFEFSNHRWNLMDDAIPLRKLMATVIVQEYLDHRAKLAQKASASAGEGDQSKNLELEMKKCTAMISALKSCGFQDKVLRMSKIMFHDSAFLKKIDENKLLFACENGVLDLDAKLFRDGRPDDYCTMSCGLEYRNYSPEDDEVRELDLFFQKVFPHEQRRAYFLDICCSCLEGGNINKTFVVGTGSGDNAKSVVFGMLELVFGEYSIKFPQELFLVGRGNSSGGARPELARVRGKRLAVVQEISKTQTLNIAVLKELTGNDSFFARNLFEKGTEIKPMFTLMMQCNEPPKVPGHDGATWERIRVVDFEAKFVKPNKLKLYPVPATFKEQMEMKRFKADLNFSRRLPDLAPVMLWTLFERFKDYKVRGIVEPEEVQIATNMYRAMNDVYLQFIHEKIEKPEYPAGTEETSKVFLGLVELHQEFTAWYAENHSSYAKGDCHNKITLEHEFNKRFHPATKIKRTTGWYGYKIAEDEALDEDQKKMQDLLLMAKATVLPSVAKATASVAPPPTKAVSKVVALKQARAADREEKLEKVEARKKKSREQERLAAKNQAKEVAKIMVAKAIPKKRVGDDESDSDSDSGEDEDWNTIDSDGDSDRESEKKTLPVKKVETKTLDFGSGGDSDSEASDVESVGSAPSDDEVTFEEPKKEKKSSSKKTITLADLGKKKFEETKSEKKTAKVSSGKSVKVGK